VSEEFGGVWRAEGEALCFSGKAGDKLISDLSGFSDGEVGVEVFMRNNQDTNAGLLARVAQPRKGTDTFYGYEIRLECGCAKRAVGTAQK